MGILEFLHVTSELFNKLLVEAEKTLRLLTVNYVSTANYFPSVLASFALQKAIEKFVSRIILQLKKNRLNICRMYYAAYFYLKYT